MDETDYLLNGKKNAEILLSSIAKIRQGEVLQFPTLQSYKDFHTFLTLQIQGLTTHQAKKLTELLLLNFLENLSNDFYQKELPSQKPYFEALYQEVKIPIDKWNLIDIKKNIKYIDQIIEDMGDDYPADMDSTALNFLILLDDYLKINRMRVHQKILSKVIDFTVIYFDWVDSELEETADIETWATHSEIRPAIHKFIGFLENVCHL